MARSKGCTTSPASVGTGPSAVAATPRTNFEALSSLMASLRPIFICPSSKMASEPGRALAAQ